jgi:hypothetical protein
MKTAVQLRLRTDDDKPRSELLFGCPDAMAASALGPIAVFESGVIVAYVVRRNRRVRLFVFRTLEVDHRLAATVPGVPRVRLLMEARSAGRIRRMRGLFAYLDRTSCPPSALADAFFVRVGVALGGRLPRHKILLSLLPGTPGSHTHRQVGRRARGR